MAQRCDVLMPDGKRCGGTQHVVIRPTKGGPGGCLCIAHQRELGKGKELKRKGGWVFFLPKASRVRARIMRGG